MQDYVFETEIHDLNSSGQGVGRYEHLATFIDGALPGERVLAKIIEKKKRYARASLKEVLEPSKSRTEPICPIFEVCGGCQIMHLDYPSQVEYKQNKVKNALSRIAGIDAEVLPAIRAEDLYYRNKIQLPFFQKGAEVSLGLYKKNSHDIVEVNTCFIHSKLGQQIFETLKKILKKTHLRVFDPKLQKGFLRHLLMRTSEHSRECLVVFITQTSEYHDALKKIGQELMHAHPEVIGVLQNINSKRYNSILGDQVTLLLGRDHLFEEILDLKVKISSHAFFQVNTKAAEKMFQVVLNLADLSKEDTVLDAYCGIGIYSLLFAKHVKETVGIECIPSAIEDARANANLNHLSNTRFIVGQVEDHSDLLKQSDVVLLNPPRKGVELSVLKSLLEGKPKKIIYVSCDPATLARDLKELTQGVYQIDVVQPIDLFPQTTHVETCVRLSLQSPDKK